MTGDGRTERGMIVRLSLVMAVALLGLALAIVALINASNQAEDQRQQLKEATQVIGALGCERAERIAKDKDPRLGRELQSKGVVTISSPCQEYVDLLGKGLVYEDGKIKEK